MTDEQRSDDIQRIRVDRLPASVDEATIRALFEPFGEVLAYERSTDEQTEAAGAYVLIRMDQLDADRAIAALDGAKLDGQAVHVSPA